MLDKRRTITAAATLLIAAGAGYFMQNGDALAARMGIGEKTSRPATTLPIATFSDVARHLPSDMAMPMLRAPAAVAPIRQAALDGMVKLPELSENPVHTPFQTTCATELTANAAPGALVELTVAAPCFANSHVTIRHAGLTFRDDLDADGNLRVDVPAMAQAATISVELRNGETHDVDVAVPELALFDRVALTWLAPGMLHIHAHEFGATDNSDGHIWAESAATADTGALGRGGFMTLLGNAAVPGAQLAEVYSYPAGLVARDGSIGISVEATVDEASCGREVTGHAIEIQQGETIRDVSLQLHIPECDGQFGFLMLKNLLQDLKIARN